MPLQSCSDAVARWDYSSGIGAEALAYAELDGDEIVDTAAANGAADTLSVL